MTVKPEKNVSEFNKDVRKFGTYAYTNPDIYSARVVAKKQSYEIMRMVRRYSPKKTGMTILDIGSGDGTYTFELFEHFKPKKIVGFDYAEDGVNLANKRIRKKHGSKIRFIQCSIYDVKKHIKEHFDVAVIRGVLHHLYEPQKGIEAISSLADTVIAAEPNGYCIPLKIIEKVSLYHRQHEEKSYWPPMLNRWFENNGFRVKKQYFYCIVPIFCNETVARILHAAEPYLEPIPFLNRIYCSTNMVVYEK